MCSLDEVQEAVSNLYLYRDHYVENEGLDKAAQKTEDVGQMMEKTADKLEALKDQIKDKALYHMLLGKTLNVLPSHSPKAEEYLSKAVKLDPKLVEAWNQLGESYWKCGNVEAAKNCFTGALSHSKNKISLRNLSMVMRQLGGSGIERTKMIEESVEKAKEAVQLDIQDGTSWLILGNAYMSLFFAAGQNPKSLKSSMSAYAQAEKDPVAKNNPDLHYNRSVAYKYQEEYQLSLEGFDRAVQLDPGWTEPQSHLGHLLSLLTNTVELTHAKGKLKPKKLQTLAQTVRDEDLGPYGGGTYKSPLGKSINLERCKLGDLKSGVNSEKVISGRVVCTVTHSEPVPFIFCMVDEDETCLPVSVYNLTQGAGVKIGDSVAIPEPFIQQVKVNFKQHNFDYSNIRVDSPLVLVVNGKKLGIDKQAPSQVGFNTKND